MRHHISRLGDEHILLADAHAPRKHGSNSNDVPGFLVLGQPEPTWPGRIRLVQPTHAVKRSWHAVHRLRQTAHTGIIGSVSLAETDIAHLRRLLPRLPDVAVADPGAYSCFHQCSHEGRWRLKPPRDQRYAAS